MRTSGATVIVTDIVENTITCSYINDGKYKVKDFDKSELISLENVFISYLDKQDRIVSDRKREEERARIKERIDAKKQKL